jgi:hypothetical protein
MHGMNRRLAVVLHSLVLATSAIAQAAPKPPAAKPAPTPPIRVLYLADAPGFDFRYVRNILAHTPGIELRVRMHGAQVEDADGTPRPDRSSMDGYDVILVADLSLGRTRDSQPYTTLDVLGVLMRGGGVGFVCGEPVPRALRSSGLEKMVPVQLLPETVEPAERVKARLLPPADEPLHPILQFEGSSDPRADFAQLPSVRYVHTVQHLARDAKVLLCDPEHWSSGQPSIVAAAGKYNNGRTVYVGTDQTWAWREPAGEQFQAAFWRNVVRYLAGRLQ